MRPTVQVIVRRGIATLGFPFDVSVKDDLMVLWLDHPEAGFDRWSVLTAFGHTITDGTRFMACTKPVSLTCARQRVRRLRSQGYIEPRARVVIRRRLPPFRMRQFKIAGGA